MDVQLRQLDSHGTVVRRSFHRVAYFELALPNDLASVLWNHPSSLVQQGELLRSSAARKTVRLEWSSTAFVLKHYAEPTRRHAVKQLVLSSRAKRTWDFARRLVVAGVATPRPLACIENRHGPFRRDSFLVYPYVLGRTLQSCIAEDAKRSPAVREQLWRQIHEVWQRLLDLRVSLEDTNLANFIVSPSGQLWLIDLDKSRIHQRRKDAAPYQQRAWKNLLRSVAYYN